jgi:hypothetical protein
MNTKKINDIKVHDFVDLSPSKETMRAIEIAQAKELLKSAGYFVDNLWKTCDVTMNYDCTEEEAQEVLEGALTNEAIFEQIWMDIRCEADNMNLKRRD